MWELPGEHGGPDAALALFARTPRLRIAVCGGDGTAGWVLSALDALWAAQCLGPDTPKPPVAILPLGTGNDLARTLGWAAAHGWGLEKGGAPDVASFLRDADRATVALLDRWAVGVTEQSADAGGSAGGGASGGATTTVTKLMNNYMSIGMDAKVALDFHSTREAHPEWFRNQAGNKLLYTGLGAGELLAHSCQGLPRLMTIHCDGVPLRLPPEVEGVVILNIGSYMGGVELWKRGRPAGGTPRGGSARGSGGAGGGGGASDGADTDSSGDGGGEGGGRGSLGPQAINDRLLEVVGHYGTWHLGKLHIGMAKALQLAQCSRIHITTSGPLPMQVDGEPWMQEAPCELAVTHHSQALMLRRSRRNDGDGTVFGVVSGVLDRATSEGVISAEQRTALVTEIARQLTPVS